MPKHEQQAGSAAEDPDFYTNSGISPSGIGQTGSGKPSGGSDDVQN
ncbi:MAG: hypothetical protein IPM08_15180 [Actinomycetales bacterium]|nr:hypothetical protein [Actinomycetales bacterium]